jgi:hypothetical protein
MTTGSAVAVTITDQDGAGGSCRVTIEAVSPDADCPGDVGSSFSAVGCQAQGIAQPMPPPPLSGATPVPLCPPSPILACKLTYAPGADNDAAVDELARRVQDALGPTATVN